MAATPETQDANATVTYDGKEYEVVREGLAEILNYKSSSVSTQTATKTQAVFYNPIQQFNRDLSVLAIRAFGEDLATIRRLRKDKKSAKQDGQRGKKRKRGPEEGGLTINSPREKSIEDVATNTAPEMKSPSVDLPANEGQNSSATTESHHRHESDRSRQDGEEVVINPVPKGPKADRDRESRQQLQPVGK